MPSISRKLIEYEGISDIHLSSKNSNIFKQFIVSEILDIPEAKPDIEQIVKVSVLDIKTDSRIIETPRGTSLEGVHLTGWKVIINGQFNIRVQYVANVPEQSVHVAHFEIPFSNFIVVPTCLVEMPNIFTNVYIEDIFSNQLDLRRIFNSVTLLVTINY